MAGYVVGVTEVTDPQSMAEYQQKVGPIIERYGGRFVAAGPVTEVLEGDMAPHAAVVIAFDSPAAAQRWYDSAEYAEIRPVRHRAGRSAVFVLGPLPMA